VTTYNVAYDETWTYEQWNLTLNSFTQNSSAAIVGGTIDNVIIGSNAAVIVDSMTLGTVATFVPGRITALDSSGVPLINLWTSNNVSSGIVTGFTLNQAFSGTLAAVTNASYNSFTVASDNVDLKGGTGSVLGIYDAFGGSNMTGSRIASTTTVSMTAPSNNKAAGYSTEAIAYGTSAVVATAAVNDGGTSISPYGSLFGTNAGVHLLSGATYWNKVRAAGFTTNIQTGASVAYKYGIGVYQTYTDKVQGTQGDAAVHIGGQAGCVGWQYLFAIGGPDGVRAMNSGTTIMYVQNSSLEISPPTIQGGIDLSNVSISGYAFKSSGFSVDGNGNITIAGTLTAGAVRAGAFTAGAAILPLTQSFSVSTLGQSVTLTSASSGWTAMYVNGLRQDISMYSISGNVLTLNTQAAEIGDFIVIDYIPN
jgi:hypothetical protein